ncbi:menaquinone biosynthesis decarboxylase [Archaeoglobus veneficus]|uniref:Menaquinone biosynthesis decarboxylase, SCO4490 family n=1 Tax=Archaeoglobus veneficus (strain DSM 11195 / SNP6) TaxID=693661 RepID=F2KR98_ARCVS|nr:menaquinone biosynthesis decarboxylase [Archaeoglobus veneficus]AEA47832.1 menaquinone biosynthesis decarboxylase, SCO4490 family [Archaeoglobus veneficus SNP6]
MPYEDLREFIERLENEGELARIKHEVSPVLEMTEIADRTVKAGGKALLFEKPKGYNIPVLMNAFGTERRMKLALEVERLEEIGERLVELTKIRPSSFLDGLKSLGAIKDLASFMPKNVKKGPCKEVIMDEPDLTKFPILKCWPNDAGPFITLPAVITKDPETGELNVGMYRMQVFDGKTTGMHWQIHKHGAMHFRKLAEKGEDKLEVAVAIGVDPAILYASTAPLPENLSEFMFAGFIRRERVKLVDCETVDLKVPATAEIVLEGYVKADELRIEGPFGDHTGYYTPPEPYPVFHVTCITHRENPIYHATVVGKPPMEDAWLGKATERIFLPLIKMIHPEIVDINLPVEAAFHNLAIVSIKKRYPGHAKKVMFALWSMGMLSLTKVVIVVDDDVNVQNMQEVIWAITSRFDPARDVIIIPEAPIDSLDHSTYKPNLGGKLGIDATKKWKEEGFEREWPDAVEMSPDVKQKIDAIWGELSRFVL